MSIVIPSVEILPGRVRALHALVLPDGARPAMSFLDALEVEARARYWVHFKIMCDAGPQALNHKHFHKWDAEKNKAAAHFAVFKDNPSQTRMVCFPSGDQGVLVLAFGFGGKKEREVDPVHIDRAVKYRDDFMSRRTAQATGSAVRSLTATGKAGGSRQ